MEHKEKLKSEIKKLRKVINQLGYMDIVNSKTEIAKKQQQGKLNKAYGTIVDVKVNLEAIVEEMED